MSTIISPTPGRIVWFWPFGHPNVSGEPGEAFAAIVAYVWNDRLVNLGVFDKNGNSMGIANVTLVQEGDPLPEGSYATWMPYQLGQAKARPQVQEGTS